MSIVDKGLRRLGNLLPPKSAHCLKSLFDKLNNNSIAQSKLTKMTESAQILQFFVFAALTGEIDELSSLSLSTLFDAFCEKAEMKNQVKAMLKGAHELLCELKMPFEESRRVMLQYGHFRLVYISLCTLCERFDIDANIKKRIWLSLLVLMSNEERKGIDCMIELIAALLFLCGNGQKHATFISSFEDNTHYCIEEEELNRRCEEAIAGIPDLLSFEFDAKKYEKIYLGKLGRCDISYIHFLENEQNEPSVPGTPMPATPLNVLEQPNQIIGRARTSTQTLTLCRLPNISDEARIGNGRQLLSPLVKREVDSLDYFRNHAELLEWIKEMANSVELVRITVGGEPEMQISTYVRPFADVPNVRRNFYHLSALLSTLSSTDVQLFTKFFFKILEMLTERQTRVDQRKVLEDRSFMVSLFAFCYELRLFIQHPTDSRQSFACSHAYIDCAFDLYKILFSFSQIAYQSLPRLLKAHIYRLEYALLLKEFWRRPKPNKEYIPRRLYGFEEGFDALVLDKIRNFSAERIYLVLSALGIADELKDQIWETFDLLLAAGMDKADIEALFAFKYDIHIDTLLIATIVEWRSFRQLGFSIEALYNSYLEKVLFPLSSIREDVTKFLLDYRGVIAAMLNTAQPNRLSRRWKLNSTPIIPSSDKTQNKQKLGLSLAENLGISLEKRPYLEYSAGLSMSNETPQILSEQIETRNTFSLGFKRIKIDDIRCDVPPVHQEVEPHSVESPGTPSFGQ